MLEYTVAAVAALSVQSPFIHPRFPSLKKSKKPAGSRDDNAAKRVEQEADEAENKAKAKALGLLDNDSDSDIGFDSDYEAENLEEAKGMC